MLFMWILSREEGMGYKSVARRIGKTTGTGMGGGGGVGS
jgi:hypothetical protein